MTKYITSQYKKGLIKAIPVYENLEGDLYIIQNYFNQLHEELNITEGDCLLVLGNEQIFVYEVDPKTSCLGNVCNVIRRKSPPFYYPPR